MDHSEAVWVARQYLRTHSPGRVGMLLSDEAELAICEALVSLSEKGITLGAACCEREKAELRAEIDEWKRAALTQPFATQVREVAPDASPSPTQVREDRIYPCAKCGVLRTKAEGGTTFTVCDVCWDSSRDARKAGSK